MKGEPIIVILRFTPAAHGLLVALAAYTDSPDVETFIMDNLAQSVETWCEGVSNQGVVRELFLTSQVVVTKEGA